MNDVLATVLKDLGTAIEESGASITSDPLPCIMADNTQMVLLLNNLLGNAIKFRRDEPPKIHIGVTEKGGEWQFFVKDNGIGIDSAQGERIFQMFDCTPRMSTRAPASAWPWPRRSSSATAGGSGWRARRERDRPSSSPSRCKGHDDQGGQRKKMRQAASTKINRR